MVQSLLALKCQAESKMLVCDSVFRDTDRGLRIKSRRGRGKNAVIDMITFRNIDMYHVLTPFTAK